MSKQVVSREEFFAICRDHYTQDGFVKWSAVAEKLGVSRQAVSTRINKALRSGHLSNEEYERWNGQDARKLLSSELETRRADQKARTIRVVLSLKNHQWVSDECHRRRIKTGHLINEILDQIIPE